MHECHAVRVVEDDALPDGVDFVFVSVECGDVGWIFYKRSALSAETIEASWTAGSALGRPGPARSGDVRHLRRVV